MRFNEAERQDTIRRANAKTHTRTRIRAAMPELRSIIPWSILPPLRSEPRSQPHHPRQGDHILLKSAISRQAKASKLPLVLWLNEIVEFHPTFPALGRVSKLSLLSLIGNALGGVVGCSAKDVCVFFAKCLWLQFYSVPLQTQRFALQAINREWGENPRLSRSCDPLFAVQAYATDYFREGACNQTVSQKTCLALWH